MFLSQNVLLKLSIVDPRRKQKVPDRKGRLWTSITAFAIVFVILEDGHGHGWSAIAAIVACFHRKTMAISRGKQIVQWQGPLVGSCGVHAATTPS